MTASSVLRIGSLKSRKVVEGGCRRAVPKGCLLPVFWLWPSTRCPHGVLESDRELPRRRPPPLVERGAGMRGAPASKVATPEQDLAIKPSVLFRDKQVYDRI